jgi:hypothetical protein
MRNGFALGRKVHEFGLVQNRQKCEDWAGLNLYE